MNELGERDEALDRLLAGLGSAEPDAGFSQRVVMGVEARRANVRPAGIFSGTLAGRPRFVWGFGLASACALALLMAGVVLDWHRVERRPVEQEHVASAAKGVPRRLRPEVSRGRDGSAEGVRLVRLVKASATIAKGVTPSHEDHGAAEVASFPAPPLPLTEQERLLLKIVRRRDVVEMAMLDPRLQAIEEATDRAQFEEFFKPPLLPVEPEPQPAAKPQGATQ